MILGMSQAEGATGKEVNLGVVLPNRNADEAVVEIKGGGKTLGAKPGLDKTWWVEHWL